MSGDAVDVVARLKEESDVPLRSHGSLSLNWALMAAGLVDRVQVTIFPVITGKTGTDPIFEGAADFDLELVENRTLDGHTQELIYRPDPPLRRPTPSGPAGRGVACRPLTGQPQPGRTPSRTSRRGPVASASPPAGLR